MTDCFPRRKKGRLALRQQHHKTAPQPPMVGTNQMTMAPTRYSSRNAFALLLCSITYIVTLAAGEFVMEHEAPTVNMHSATKAWQDHLKNGQVPRRDRVNIPVDYMGNREYFLFAHHYLLPPRLLLQLPHHTFGSLFTA